VSFIIGAIRPDRLDCDFAFTGHYYHAAAGLHLAPFRAYDAETARWLSVDPIRERGGLNLYGYVENEPVRFWDPLGLNPRCSLATGIARAVKSGDIDALKLILQGLDGPAASAPRTSITRLETPIGRLINGTKKGSKSWHGELAEKILADVIRQKDTGIGAAKKAAEQMLKLAEKGNRLSEKCEGKN